MRVNYKEVGKRIQMLRKEKNLSQEQLADKLNISANMIAKVECGIRKPSVDLVIEFSKFFKKPIDYIILGKEVGKKADAEAEIDQAIAEVDQAIMLANEIKKKLIQRKENLKK